MMKSNNYSGNNNCVVVVHLYNEFSQTNQTIIVFIIIHKEDTLEKCVLINLPTLFCWRIRSGMNILLS